MREKHSCSFECFSDRGVKDRGRRTCGFALWHLLRAQSAAISARALALSFLVGCLSLPKSPRLSLYRSKDRTPQRVSQGDAVDALAPVGLKASMRSAYRHH